MLHNKKAEGTAFAWIFGLITLGVMGIAFIVLNQAISVYVQPAFDTVKNMSVTNATLLADINAEESRYMAYWLFIPFIVFTIVIIWMILNATRKNEQDQYK